MAKESKAMETEEPVLDPVQEQMLGAIARLCEKNPSGRFPYTRIHDEARADTKNGNKDEKPLKLDDMKRARLPLVERGLVRCEGNTFALTDLGKTIYRERKQVSATAH